MRARSPRDTPGNRETLPPSDPGPGEIGAGSLPAARHLRSPTKTAPLTWQAVSNVRRQTPPERRLSVTAERSTAPAFRLELARPAHAAGMLAIYNPEIEAGTATFEMSPRSIEEQLEWIAEHSGAHPAVVAVTTGDDGEDVVIGFGSLSPYRPRAAYSTTVENSVYVAEGYQRLGIGRAILEELLHLAKAHGFHAVIARIGGRERRLRGSARVVRVRDDRHREGGGPQARPVARRRVPAAPHLTAPGY